MCLQVVQLTKSMKCHHLPEVVMGTAVLAQRGQSFDGCLLGAVSMFSVLTLGKASQ